jgi:hypothetical protein
MTTNFRARLSVRVRTPRYGGPQFHCGDAGRVGKQHYRSLGREIFHLVFPNEDQQFTLLIGI